MLNGAMMCCALVSFADDADERSTACIWRESRVAKIADGVEERSRRLGDGGGDVLEPDLERVSRRGRETRAKLCSSVRASD